MNNFGGEKCLLQKRLLKLLFFGFRNEHMNCSSEILQRLVRFQAVLLSVSIKHYKAFECIKRL